MVDFTDAMQQMIMKRYMRRKLDVLESTWDDLQNMSEDQTVVHDVETAKNITLMEVDLQETGTGNYVVLLPDTSEKGFSQGEKEVVSHFYHDNVISYFQDDPIAGHDQVRGGLTGEAAEKNERIIPRDVVEAIKEKGDSFTVPGTNMTAYRIACPWNTKDPYPGADYIREPSDKIDNLPLITQENYMELQNKITAPQQRIVNESMKLLVETGEMDRLKEATEPSKQPVEETKETPASKPEESTKTSEPKPEESAKTPEPKPEPIHESTKTPESSPQFVDENKKLKSEPQDEKLNEAHHIVDDDNFSSSKHGGMRNFFVMVPNITELAYGISDNHEIWAKFDVSFYHDNVANRFAGVTTPSKDKIDTIGIPAALVHAIKENGEAFTLPDQDTTVYRITADFEGNFYP